MHVNEWLRAIAGALIVISVALAYLVSPWYLLFTAFVGVICSSRRSRAGVR